MEEKVKPLHFTQAYNVDKAEAELDFFDSNLIYDTRAFIDPFLIRKSSKAAERALFSRFGDFFRRAYDISRSANPTKGELASLKNHLDFPEPKAIGLGYTEASHSGSGPGESFTKRLMNFFLENSARRFLKNTEVFEDKEFNPVTLEIFVDRLGPDGISDISANLIMDYLIEYTQKQCKALGVPLKELPLETDGYDFGEQEWRGGQYYNLPENPLRPGKPVVLVPKRFLRAYDMDGESMQSAVKGILSQDSNLTKRFGSLLARNVDDIPAYEIRALFLEEHGVFKRYLEHLQVTHAEAYDFVADAQHLMALKTFRAMFADLKRDEKISSCDDVLALTKRFLSIVEDHFSSHDGWKDAWTDDLKKERKEEAIGRSLRAMGLSFFDAYPNVAFETQVNMGGGPVDFRIIYLDCRITIEFKKLSNSASAGDPPLPAYIHGIQRQLPIYTYDSKANHAIYVTMQHYTAITSPKRHYDARVIEIEALVPVVQKDIRSKQSNFKTLIYINILAVPRVSASKA